MIATIGEALVDLLEQPGGGFEACLGGSVCNFTIGMARQGVPTTYLNPLSVDSFGKRFLTRFSESSVHLASGMSSTWPTAIAIVNLDDQGTPSYAFHRQSVADRDISAESLVARFPEQMELLHTGGLALVPEDLGKALTAIRAAISRGALVSIDANLRPIAVRQHDQYIEGVMHALGTAHIVKVSDEDLGHLGFGDATLDELGRIFFDNTLTQLIALTRGGDGAALLTRAARIELPAPAGLDVIDTVGAGDCFHAGLIAYLRHFGHLDAERIKQLDQATLRDALRHALAAASINIMRAGCNPATWEETVGFKNKMPA